MVVNYPGNPCSDKDLGMVWIDLNSQCYVSIDLVARLAEKK